MSKDSDNDSKGLPDGVERRRGERRQSNSDRRQSDRVVSEPKPRRQRSGRRSSDK